MTVRYVDSSLTDFFCLHDNLQHYLQYIQTINCLKKEIILAEQERHMEPTALIAVCFKKNYCHKFENGFLFLYSDFQHLSWWEERRQLNCQEADFICFVSQNICLVQI